MKKISLILIAAVCAMCFALSGCGGSSSNSSTDAPSPNESANSSSTEVDNHNSYFVGKWDLYESADYSHEQVAQIVEQYATDADYRAKLKEAVGRDDEIGFCAIFEADGTGTMDIIGEVVPFTWEATNDGAVTFTSFGGEDTKYHVPVIDGKFTLDNGDTYAKAE